MLPDEGSRDALIGVRVIAAEAVVCIDALRTLASEVPTGLGLLLKSRLTARIFVIRRFCGLQPSTTAAVEPLAIDAVSLATGGVALLVGGAGAVTGLLGETTGARGETRVFADREAELEFLHPHSPMTARTETASDHRRTDQVTGSPKLSYRQTGTLRG